MKFEIELDDKDLTLISIDMDGVVIHTTAAKSKYLYLFKDELKRLYEECDAQSREEEYGKR